MQVERRRSVGGASSVSKAKVTLQDLQALAPVVMAPPFPEELAGCVGVSMIHLLGKASAGVGVLAGATNRI